MNGDASEGVVVVLGCLTIGCLINRDCGVILIEWGAMHAHGKVWL